jgi:crotonobetainyl-CoA:carnitine CoA-transferase CaiB-like acyl-CoA transferase
MLLAPDKPWPEFCEIIGMPELEKDPLFVTGAVRIENGAELCKILTERIGSRTWAEWAPKFLSWNAPWELIRTIHELGEDPQLKASGTVFPMTLSNGVTVQVVAGPMGFDGHCAPDAPTGSPALGEHSDAILGEIGVEQSELARLRAAQIIG